MATFRSEDGREIEEKDILNVVKYYEYLFNAKHPEIARAGRSNRGGSRPKPAAKVRKALETNSSTLAKRAAKVSSNGKTVLVHVL